MIPFSLCEEEKSEVGEDGRIKGRRLVKEGRIKGKGKWNC